MADAATRSLDPGVPTGPRAVRGGVDALALPAVPPPAPATHPWRDRVLVALFVAALVLLALVDPLRGHRLDVENRSPAAWPGWPSSADWFARFDAAFSDRFRGRPALVALQHAVAVLGLHSSPVARVVIGRDGWLYFAGEDAHALDRQYRGTLPYPDAVIAGLGAEIEKRRAWLAARGIAYVVTIAPDKSTIYPEHLPRWLTRMPGPTPLDRASGMLAANRQLRFVDLRPVLREAKQHAQVYYRTDSHWNFLGATAAYGALMREVQDAVGRDRLPDIVPPERPPYVPGVDTYRGDLAGMLGVRGRYLEADIAPLAKVLVNSPNRCAQRADAGEFPGFEFYQCPRRTLRLVMYRDSFAIPLIPLLSENFGRAVYVSSQRMDAALIEREKPDVVIEEMVERSMNAPGALKFRG
jgi:hypothetical protein